ncbi:MAG: hypothetical protein K6B75_00105 [Lachnospiraceae bacterium]|nr:hypothetical protein [Lachnospiraceae bacterium]
MEDENLKSSTEFPELRRAEEEKEARKEKYAKIAPKCEKLYGRLYALQIAILILTVVTIVLAFFVGILSAVLVNLIYTRGYSVFGLILGLLGFVIILAGLSILGTMLAKNITLIQFGSDCKGLRNVGIAHITCGVVTVVATLVIYVRIVLRAAGLIMNGAVYGSAEEFIRASQGLDITVAVTAVSVLSGLSTIIIFIFECLTHSKFLKGLSTFTAGSWKTVLILRCIGWGLSGISGFVSEVAADPFNSYYDVYKFMGQLTGLIAFVLFVVSFVKEMGTLKDSRNQFRLLKKNAN